MADFAFEITSGPYKAVYSIDLADFSASEAQAFRHAVGVSLAHVFSEDQADIDAVAGLVWIVRRRGGGAKGLPFVAVANEINYGNVAPLDDSDATGEDGSVDPTTPPSNAAG